MFIPGKKVNGKQKQKKALTGKNATRKCTRAMNVRVARDSKFLNLRLNKILQRTRSSTTRLNYTEERGFGVIARENLKPGSIAVKYPGKVMTMQTARRLFSHLEDHWYDISKGNRDLVIVPAIERIDAITKTGITSLGCIANEPSIHELPNTFMTIRKRKKPIVVGSEVTLYLIVGRGCTVKAGEEITHYYGETYLRNYNINKTGCQEFLNKNCLNFH